MKINQDIMSTYILLSNFMKINQHIGCIIKLYENKSGHYCNLGNDWSHRHWTLTAYPLLAWSTLLK
jgi:hypothetical protein